MEISKTLEKLETICENLETVGDITRYSSEETFKILRPLLQNYNDILAATSDDMVINTAQGAILFLAEINPSFNVIVDDILYPNNDIGKADSPKKVKYIDPNKLDVMIRNTVSEYEKAVKIGYDSEKFGDIEWKLHECYSFLLANKDMFPEEIYTELNVKVVSTLGQISSFDNIIKSAAIQRMNGYTKIGLLTILSIAFSFTVIIFGTLLR